MSAEWGSVAIAAVSATVSGLSFVSSTRAQVAKKKMMVASVDATAYQRARDIYEAGIRELERRNSALEADIRRLEAQLARLKAALHAAGIPPPPAPPPAGGRP